MIKMVPGMVVALFTNAVMATEALPDPLAAGWDGKPVCEALHSRDDLRVLRCTFPPDGGHERHFHPAHFGYALSGGRMHLKQASGEREVTLQDDSFFASNGVDWHEVRNVGKTTVSYLIIEPRSSVPAVMDEPIADEPFAFLAGRWCAREGSVTFEEMWMPALGGQTQGVGRTVENGRPISSEHLRIAPLDGVPTLFASPAGQTTTAFALTDSGSDWARFENPQHDFPKMIEYRRHGAAMQAIISGDDRSKTFDFEPCAGSAR